MNSYENVMRAIEFKTPERIPCDFASLGISDIHYFNWNQTGTGDNLMRETYDEWGCLWARTEVANMGQVKGFPLENWENLDLFVWPDPNNESFYEGMEGRLEGSDGKYVLISIFMLLFERMHSLRGFENTLLDLCLEKEKIGMLADRIVDFNICIIENIAKRFPGKIHGLNFSDDWGTELDTFISPKLWDEFFKARYKKIFDAAKNHGWHIWMHSCGKINKIIDSLIEIGVDVLNLQQPRVLGIEEIGKKYAGRVCFSTVCDIQKTLPFEDENYIEYESSLIINNWGTPKGGIILSDYGDGKAIGVSLEKKKIMFNAFMRYDIWVKKTI